MKHRRLSLTGIFWLMGAGVLATAAFLSIGVFFVTKDQRAAVVSLITAAAVSVWGVLLVKVLQKHLTAFTNDVCQRIDNMMQGEAAPRAIFDEDTLLDRINHQLSRLYAMQQADKQTIDRQRADLQGMISDISHQVKTPITNLKMAALTLIEQPLPRPQQLEYLQSMAGQIDKLDFLMQAMVKSSRLETGVIVLKKQEAPLYETLAAALGSIFWQAEAKQLRLTVDCPEEICLPHDPKWTAEALFNLLENAVKYTPAGGSIQVQVVRWEAYTKIDISDTGRGIAENQQAAIFKRFYREPDVHNIAGIGIGLYLTREIIAKQGGRIKVTSAAGRGATFTIYLPND